MVEMSGVPVERFTRKIVDQVIGGWVGENRSIRIGRKSAIEPHLRPCLDHDISIAQDNQAYTDCVPVKLKEREAPGVVAIVTVPL